MNMLDDAPLDEATHAFAVGLELGDDGRWRAGVACGEPQLLHIEAGRPMVRDD